MVTVKGYQSVKFNPESAPIQICCSAVDAVSLDFSKTFHMVCHNILIPKLEKSTSRWVENGWATELKGLNQ